MGIATSRLGLGVAWLLWASGSVWAADLPISGKVTVVKGSKLAKFVSKSKQQPGQSPFSIPTPGSLEDPTIGGAVVQFFDTNSAGAGLASFELDASGWAGLGNPPGSKGYKYKGKEDVNDPDPSGTCKTVLLKEKVIKATCKGSAVTLMPPYVGEAGVVLGIPAGSAAVRYCASFDGTTQKNDTKLLKRKDASPPSECPFFCAGFSFEDACWFGSGLGESCADACAGEGLVYDEATRTVAGSDGTDENCMAVLSGLSFPAAWGGSFACGISGVGCSSIPIDFVSARCFSPPTTAEASEPNISRVCACR